MVEQQLTFDDGTICRDSHAMLMSHGLYVFLNGIPLEDAEQILSDVAKTQKIIYQCYKVKFEYCGYTDLVSISKAGNAVSAMLAKPEKEGAE